MEPNDGTGPAGARPKWDDPGVVSFVGTDYLGMSANPTVQAAAIEALQQHGVSASAARTTTGTLGLHLDLERALSEFLGTEDAVVLASGAHAASAVVESLAHRVGNWWVDEHAHPCVDAPLATQQRVRRYPHLGPDLTEGHHTEPSALLTDAVFPEVGRTIDANTLAATADSTVQLCIDESHAIGVLGSGGRGLAHALAGQRNYLQFGSMAKALGGFGGFVAASGEVCDDVRNRSSAYASSTALPPSICAALAAAVGLLRDGSDALPRLQTNVAQLRHELVEIEVADATAAVPIFFAPLPDTETATAWHEALLDDGLFVPVAGYLSKSGLIGLRWVVTALHQADDLSRLAQRLRTLHADAT